MIPRTSSELLRTNTIVKHYAGSHAYGTALPTSDVDFRGVFCADPINIRTPFFPVMEVDVSEEEDTKLYELAHFMKLCLDCNPNVVETLWVDDQDITIRTPAYDKLREHRYDFLSSKIAFTTSGYAMSQLKRIKGHEKWITQADSGMTFIREYLENGNVSAEWVATMFNDEVVNAMTSWTPGVVHSVGVAIKQKELLNHNGVRLLLREAPKQYQFLSVIQWFGEGKNLKVQLDDYRDDHRLIPYGKATYGVYKWEGYKLWSDEGHLNDLFEGVPYELGKPIMIVKLHHEDFVNAVTKHGEYRSWRSNRNLVRSELEAKYNYDTKHAMHLVRLLRMGKEVLSTGELIVKRPDAEELLAIRNGLWTYEEAIKYAEAIDAEIKELYANTKLRKKPDIKLAARVLIEVQDLVWSNT